MSARTSLNLTPEEARFLITANEVTQWKGWLGDTATMDALVAKLERIAGENEIKEECSERINANDPGSLKCSLEAGHEGLHRGANSVTWNYNQSSKKG